MEAALIHHYAGRDPIGEYWNGEISLRDLRVLVEGLPQDSAVHRKMLGHNWTSDWQWLAAEQSDALNALVTMFYNANRAENKPALDSPKPWPRPGAEDQRALNELRERQAHDRLHNLLLPGR